MSTPVALAITGAVLLCTFGYLGRLLIRFYDAEKRRARSANQHWGN